MKIAHLISNYFPTLGGAQMCVHHLAKRSAERGHESFVVTTTPGLDNGTDLGYGVIHINPFLTKLGLLNFKTGGALLRKEIRSLQDRYGFDLWQVTVGYPLGAAAVDFFNEKRIPCVLRPSGEDIQLHEGLGYGYRMKKDVDRIIRVKYPRFNAVIAPGERAKGDYLSLGVPEDRIELIPQGVDLARFSGGEGNQRVADAIGLQNGERFLVTIGRNHPKKGFEIIPEIASRLLESGVRFKWLLAGKGNKRLVDKAESMGMRGVFAERDIRPLFGDGRDMQVPAPEIISIYKAADVFVFPTRIELFAKAVIEALAAGSSVVTTFSPGVDDIIEDGENGLKCDPGDARCFAEKIDRVLRDGKLAAHLRENARRSSVSYGWDEISGRYFSLYERIGRR